MPGRLPSGPRRDSGFGLQQTEACAPRRIETPANWEALIPEGTRETSFSELCRCRVSIARQLMNRRPLAAGRARHQQHRHLMCWCASERLKEGDDARGPDHPLRPHLLKPSATDLSSHQQPQCDWAGEAMHMSVGGHVWLRRREAGFFADPAREALD